MRRSSRYLDPLQGCARLHRRFIYLGIVHVETRRQPSGQRCQRDLIEPAVALKADASPACSMKEDRAFALLGPKQQ